MAERFRIDLGYPSLFGSLSYDGTGITDGVVVYDITTQQLFYTGAYGGSGGDIIISGSFLTGSNLIFGLTGFGSLFLSLVSSAVVEIESCQ